MDENQRQCRYCKNYPRDWDGFAHNGDCVINKKEKK